ncbi:MAG: hypothetical protein EAZ91_00330 [Cytophagales bacterium]|nr:MAG: hypothetical protein EAZ91_00330 [Cytophagales bacterium]
MIHESFEKGDFIQYEVTISDDIFGLASFYFNDRDELVASMCHNLGFHNMYNPKIFEKRILELYNQLVSIYGKPYKRYIDNYSRDEYIYFRNRTNHVDLQIAHNHHNLGFGFSISSIPEWNKQQRIEAQKEAQRKNPALKKQGL